MLTLDKFEEASEKVKEVTLETKLVYSDYWSQQPGPSDSHHSKAGKSSHVSLPSASRSISRRRLFQPSSRSESPSSRSVAHEE